MLKKKRKTAPEKENDDTNSHLPVKQLKGEILLKAILDQKFQEFSAALRDEFDRQMMSGNSELRDVIFRERNDRKYANRLIFGFLSLVIVLLTANIFFDSGTSEATVKEVVKEAVTKEFVVFEEKNRVATKSLFEPIHQSVQKNLNQVTSEISLSRGYIDIFALEGLARNGSRNAFEELVKTSAKEGRKGSFAANKLKGIKDYYSFLSEPKRQNLTLGNLLVVKGGTITTTDSLSTTELIFVLNSPGATLPQIHQILTLLWEQQLNKDHEGEIKKILQKSQNLPAVIAACSILQKNFGNKGTMFDFAQWRAFLESRT